jgi:hypothetical protein
MNNSTIRLVFHNQPLNLDFLTHIKLPSVRIPPSAYVAVPQTYNHFVVPFLGHLTLATLHPIRINRVFGYRKGEREGCDVKFHFFPQVHGVCVAKAHF